MYLFIKMFFFLMKIEDENWSPAHAYKMLPLKVETFNLHFCCVYFAKQERFVHFLFDFFLFFSILILID